MLKNNIKKAFFAVLAIIFVFSMTSSVLATDVPNTNEDTDSVYSNTSLEVVENNVCHIDVGGIGEFEKQITAYDEVEKSVTLTLTFRNIKKVEESYRNVEIFFVIDNSSSMTEAFVGEGTRKAEVIQSANSLAEKLFANNPNVKIGVVGFSSLDASKGEREGTINDAQLISDLSNSQTEVSQAIATLGNSETGPRTNIEAGLTIAQNNFSEEPDTNRYIVLLTDGVPNNATDGTYATYSGTVATRTKAKLEEIQAQGVEIIGAMINLPADTVEPTTQRTYRELAEEIFGTAENPTTDVFYYVSDSQIEDTIVNDIYNNLRVVTDNTLRNITITDYFPQEIIDNFNFEYVATPNIGSVSQEIDTTNNSITWNIEMLSEGEEASLSYKLILKEDYNQEIIDQILPTNTNVDITAENGDENLNASSTVSPTIVVRYDEPTPEEPEDPEEPDIPDIIIPEDPEEPTNDITDGTVADKPIPQTGIATMLPLGIAIIVMGIAGVRFYLIRKK